MKFSIFFIAGATLELAGGNLSFRHWPISANNVIAVKSLKPAQFILLWSGHSAGSVRAVLSDEWVGGREAFWVLEERTGQSNLRSRIPSSSLLAPHSPTPSLSTVKQRGMETYSLSQCSPHRPAGETISLLVLSSFCPYFIIYWIPIMC